MPLYMGYLMWRNPQTHLIRSLYVYGINPHDPVFLMPELQSPQHQAALNRWDTTLFDRQSRAEFGPTTIGTTTEAGRRQIEIGGHFSLGTNFSADGNLLMSDRNFRRYFANRPLDRINLGLIQLKPNADVNQIATAIRQIVPADVVVLTKQQAIDRDRKFWINTTSTGFIFTMSVAVSCVRSADDQPKFNLLYGSSKVGIRVLVWEVNPWETPELTIVRACSCIVDNAFFEPP